MDLRNSTSRIDSFCPGCGRFPSGRDERSARTGRARPTYSGRLGVFAHLHLAERFAAHHQSIPASDIGGERRYRPNRIADGTLPSDQRTVDRWFDTNAFVPCVDPGSGFVPNQIFGNSGVGILRGPGLVNLDFNLAKDFAVKSYSAQFRGEVLQCLQPCEFRCARSDIGAGFGQIVSAADARIIQFALKLLF